jgi:rhodanese-related sulfurtransferase
MNGSWIWLILAALIVFMMLRARGESGAQLAALRARGARIVDVRTPAEFAGGHLPGAVNIPIQELAARQGELPREVPLLLCCASGSRSAMGVALLKRAGFQDVHNAGPWTRLRED